MFLTDYLQVSIFEALNMRHTSYICSIQLCIHASRCVAYSSVSNAVHVHWLNQCEIGETDLKVCRSRGRFCASQNWQQAENMLGCSLGHVRCVRQPCMFEALHVQLVKLYLSQWTVKLKLASQISGRYCVCLL